MEQPDLLPRSLRVGLVGRWCPLPSPTSGQDVPDDERDDDDRGGNRDNGNIGRGKDHRHNLLPAGSR